MDATPEDFDQGALRLPKAIRFSGLSKAQLYEWMKDDTLPYSLVGRVRVIPKKCLKRIMAGQPARREEVTA